MLETSSITHWYWGFWSRLSQLHKQERTYIWLYWRGKITCPPGFSMTRQERWHRQPAYTQAAARCCPLAWSPRECHNLLMMTVSTRPGMMTATVLTPPGILNAFAVLYFDDGMSEWAFLSWHDPLENLESHSDVSTLDTDFFDVRSYCSSSWRQTAPGVLSVFLVEMSGTCCNRDPGDSWRNPSVVMRMIRWWWLSLALTPNKISWWRVWEMWATRSVIQNWSGRGVPGLLTSSPSDSRLTRWASWETGVKWEQYARMSLKNSIVESISVSQSWLHYILHQTGSSAQFQMTCNNNEFPHLKTCGVLATFSSCYSNNI